MASNVAWCEPVANSPKACDKPEGDSVTTVVRFNHTIEPSTSRKPPFTVVVPV